MDRPIVHKACGGVVAYDDRPDPHDVDMTAKWFRRVDGTHPEPYTRFDEKCPVCGAQLMPSELTITEAA